MAALPPAFFRRARFVFLIMGSRVLAVSARRSAGVASQRLNGLPGAKSANELAVTDGKAWLCPHNPARIITIGMGAAMFIREAATISIGLGNL